MALFKKRSAKTPEFIAQQESRYRYELLAVASCMMMLMSSLALISYHPDDATLLHASSMVDTVHNWCGALGANVAALLFFLFGSAAYLLLSIALLPLYVLLVGALHAPLRRFSALVASVFFASVLCAAYGVDFWEMQMGLSAGAAGGIAGGAVYRFLAYALGVHGGPVLAWGLFWMALCMALRLPLFALLASAMKGIWWWVSKWLARAGAKIKAWRTPKRVIEETVTQAAWAVAPVRTVGIDVEDCVEPELEEVAPSERFANHVVRMSTLWVRVLKTRIACLPNAVIKKNMFVARGEQPSFVDALATAQAALAAAQFQLPGLDLFNQKKPTTHAVQSKDRMDSQARKVEEKLTHFGVKGSVVSIKQGPVVTLFEYKPEIDSKISKIVALEDDLTMALTAQSMRVIAPIPGKNAVGFEIANNVREDVLLSDLIMHDAFVQSKAALPMVLGVDTVGNPVVEDLARMPHLLVGGSTGSGKSVGLNTMLMSLLCKRTPDEMSLILVDPKRLEFTPYANIPHLMVPIVTQPNMAHKVLGWVVQEMERRYARMAEMGVRTFRPSVDMKYLVVIIDELADLMMVAGKEVEGHLVRLAQMARAAGIHMIVATQRPSVDVVTGLIKVNFPSRIAFRVSSKIDSRTILDTAGAERLLGRGDMLYMNASSTELRRVHGAYVADAEIERVASFVRAQREASYLDLRAVLERADAVTRDEPEDTLYPELVQFIKTADEVSISMIQRHYRIGFNRSARLIEKLESEGYLAPSQGAKPRKVIR